MKLSQNNQSNKTVNNPWVWTQLTEWFKPDRKEGETVPTEYLTKGETEYFPNKSWVEKDYVKRIEQVKIPTFFETMLREKGLSDEFFVYTYNDQIHVVEAQELLEYIEQTEGEIREQIEYTFRQIDFKNGDLKHYLKFLAEAYVECNWSVQCKC